MDKRTLKALKGSIAKWQAIVKGTGYDAGADNCPLCEEFQADDVELVCSGCPVQARTGRSFCAGTPYDRWGWVATGTWPDRRATTEEAKAVAQDEVDFLKSLLPKGK